MAYQTISFETLTAAHESVRGTAITAPTHYFPLSGSITPTDEWYDAEESTGTLSEVTRSALIRQNGEFEAEGGLDTNYLPFFLNMVAGAVTTPTTPAGATTAKLWTFTPSRTSDTIKTATMWFGDPNVSNMWRSTFGMVDELTIGSDASGTDGVTLNLSGMCQFPTVVTPPTMPTLNQGSLLTPVPMQMWLDTSSAIGTTEITNRLISNEVTLRTGATPIYGAKGPTADKSFRRMGRGKSRTEGTFAIEVDNNLFTNEWVTYNSGTKVKIRMRWNGAFIETVTGPVDLYQYAQIDLYGYIREPDWGDVEGVARTISFNVVGAPDSTVGAEYVATVQNTRATL